MTSRSRGLMGPRFALNFLTLRSEGAGNTGCKLHPRYRVQKCTKKRTRAYRFSGGNPAFPAQWFYGLFRALPGDRAFLPPSPTDYSASLTPASGRQDHTSSPSASAPFVYQRIRVHRILSHVRDDREPPLFRDRTASHIA